MSPRARGAARVVAQAKVNLFLRVLAREASGYHSLETVFARLDLADRVVVRVGGASRSIDCAGPRLPAAGLGPAEQNLAYRAAVRYAAATGWPSHFAIDIEKHIPVGGGLGGGSADAAAVLRALDRLAPRPVGPRLLDLAPPLGADVPFLASECAVALAWGRGERMLAVPPLPGRDVALVVPAFGVSTADAYGWLAETRAAYVPGAAVVRPDDLTSWPALAARAANDFEDAVTARHPAVGAWLAALRADGARLARMSGSGSAVFGVFERHAPLAATRAVDAPAEVVFTRTATGVAPVHVDAR